MCFMGVFVFVDGAESTAVAAFTDASVPLERSEDTILVELISNLH